MKVIKVESQSHALEVKKYFESQGYNADCVEFDYRYQYFGIDSEGTVDGWRKTQVIEGGWEIVELPFPRMMMVRDNEGSEWLKRLVLGIFNGYYLALTCSIEDLDAYTVGEFWSEAKEIEPVKVTIEELIDCYAKEHGISVENLKI